MPQFLLHGGYGLIINATGHYVFKVIQIWVYVKGKTMHGYPTAAAHAQRANFTGFFIIGIKPNTGVAGIAASL
jgi:hypothetical protein